MVNEYAMANFCAKLSGILPEIVGEKVLQDRMLPAASLPEIKNSLALLCLKPRWHVFHAYPFKKIIKMSRLFPQYWWVFLLRGIAAVILGLLALFMPGPALLGLVTFLGAFLVVDGIFTIISALQGRGVGSQWGWYLFIGALGILAGFTAFYNPFATATALAFLIAFWALVMGIGEIAWAIRLRKVIRGEGWFILMGIGSILFALAFFAYPLWGALALTVMFGFYALFLGVLLIALSFRLRRRRRSTA